MNISWVVSDYYNPDPLLDLQPLKNIGSIWGSWRTWRNCQTDNVICHDMKKAEELVRRNFQTQCNFYLSNNTYQKLDRPARVKIYEGEFVHDVYNQEEIVAMHLASVTSDIVLLLGFDFSTDSKSADKITQHRNYNYRSLTKQAIKDNISTQWVLIDHEHNLSDEYKELSNLTMDSLENVVKLLN